MKFRRPTFTLAQFLMFVALAAIVFWLVATVVRHDPQWGAWGQVVISPDLRLLATAQGSTIRVWSVQTQRRLATFGQPSRIDDLTSAAFSPDSRRLAAIQSKRDVSLWDVNSEKLLWTKRLKRLVTNLAFSPSGERLALGGTGERVELWETGSGDLHSEVRMQGENAVILGGTLEALAFSPDGRLLAGAVTTGHLWIWDVASGEPSHTFHDPGMSNVGGMAFSTDGKLLVSDDRGVKLWDLADGQERQVLSQRGRSLWSGIAFSPDGTKLATPSRVGTGVTVWAAPSGEVVTEAWDLGFASAMRFSQDGRTLAVVPPSRVLLWDLASGQRRTLAKERFPRVQGSVAVLVWCLLWYVTSARVGRAGLISRAVAECIVSFGALSLSMAAILSLTRYLSWFESLSLALGCSLAGIPGGLLLGTVRLWLRRGEAQVCCGGGEPGGCG